MAKHGSFVWYELLTTQKAAAEKFYAGLLGWKSQDSGQPGIDYSMIVNDGVTVGGMMTLPKEACDMGAQPGWMGYIAVSDVDASAKRTASAGGKVLREPEDIPGHGRFAILADPQGAAFCIYSLGTVAGDAHRPGVPGFGGWHELYTDDVNKALDFYGALFGWTKSMAVDMGEMGVYQLFAIDGVDCGGMMKRPAQMPVCAWNYYFNIDGIDAAAKRVTDGGGKIMMGPHQVPGGSWILMGTDPQGVLFSLTSLKQ